MNYRVIFNPEAQADLFYLYDYISSRGFPERALQYIESIEEYCLTLETFPHRGRSLEHLRPGLRAMSFERRVTIAFQILQDRVVIFRILYGGRDLDKILKAK